MTSKSQFTIQALQQALANLQANGADADIALLRTAFEQVPACLAFLNALAVKTILYAKDFNPESYDPNTLSAFEKQQLEIVKSKCAT